jgi:SM-20-related protein
MMPDPALSAHVAAELTRDGYVVVEGFLEDSTIAALASECRKLQACGALRPAAIGRARGRHLDAVVRGDHTQWFDPAALSAAQQRYWSRMDMLRHALNRELLLGLEELDAHFALYPPGARYARHSDRFRDDDARVLSTVLYLNAGWREADGGALRLYPPAQAPVAHRDIFPVAGTLVVFLSADFEHEVLPASRDRLSIAGWMRRSDRAIVMQA